MKSEPKLTKQTKTQKKWTFNGWGDEFETHILHSIPGYGLTHEMSLSFSDFFVFDDHAMLDLGAATGNFSRKLAARHPDVEITAFDNVPTMWNKNKKDVPRNLKFVIQDLTSFSFDGNASFITLIFTLQFLPYEKQRGLLAAIAKLLPEGGALMLFEKQLPDSGREELLFESALWDFKSQYFSDEEMAEKRIGIRSALNTRTLATQTKQLKAVGFSEIYTCFQCLSFYGLLAVK